MSATFRTGAFFEGDNLDVMRGINDACVDLIYLDPPFNSNRDYAAPIGSEVAGAAFKDTWDLTDVDRGESCRLKNDLALQLGAFAAGGVMHAPAWLLYGQKS